jgi:hypothetical protein
MVPLRFLPLCFFIIVLLLFINEKDLNYTQ